MGVTKNSITHRTWRLIPCINTLDTEVLQCSQLVYFSYNYDLLLLHLWLSCNCISVCFYLFIYTASLFIWLFVFASFSVLCPSVHIFYIYYCFCKTPFICLFHHPFCLIFLIAWLSQYWFSYIFDVRGSVRHSTIHTEKSNKMQHCIKIYYSIFMWSSTCFGQHTAHNQEPKTALAASGLYMLSVSSNHTSNILPCIQTRGCQCSFRFLIMGGVSPETCWASHKYGIINFDTMMHLVGFFCMN
jgi:hypothetical protein